MLRRSQLGMGISSLLPTAGIESCRQRFPPSNQCRHLVTQTPHVLLLAAKKKGDTRSQKAMKNVRFQKLADAKSWPSCAILGTILNTSGSRIVLYKAVTHSKPL